MIEPTNEALKDPRLKHAMAISLLLDGVPIKEVARMVDAPIKYVFAWAYAQGMTLGDAARNERIKRFERAARAWFMGATKKDIEDHFNYFALNRAFKTYPKFTSQIVLDLEREGKLDPNKKTRWTRWLARAKRHEPSASEAKLRRIRARRIRRFRQKMSASFAPAQSFEPPICSTQTAAQSPQTTAV